MPVTTSARRRDRRWISTIIRMMYLNFFKLQQLPFRLTGDPRFHYKDAARASAAKMLLAELGAPPAAGTEGCILISGDAGVGKTILMQDVISQLPQRFAVVQIRQPDISVVEFYAAIIAELGATPAGPCAAATPENWDECLAGFAAQRRCVVLSVDNCELLSEPMLEEILRLPRRRGTASGSLRVLLAARSPMEATLGKPRFRDRAKQLGLLVKLSPLTAEELGRYVEYRLRAAGHAGGAIFDDDAVAEIHRYTGGVPRLINTLADAAMVGAFNRSHDTITAVEIRAAASQLQWVEFGAREGNEDAKANIAEECAVGHVRIEHENAVVAEFDLPVGKISVGRAMNNDVRIDSCFVSRNHCRIVTTAEYSVIEDLQSQNGLIVASRRVSVHRLRHGDQVGIGEHTLTFTRSRHVEPAKPWIAPLSLASSSGTTDTDRTRVISLAGEGEAGPKDR